MRLLYETQRGWFYLQYSTWFHGVMVSTLDFESKDPSSSLGGTSNFFFLPFSLLQRTPNFFLFRSFRDINFFFFSFNIFPLLYSKVPCFICIKNRPIYVCYFLVKQVQRKGLFKESS